MDLKHVLLAIMIVLGLLIDKGLSIDCWVCDSDSDPSNCGESINAQNLQDSLSTGSNCAACGKTFSSLGTIWSTVKRTCLTTASNTCDNKIGYGSCSCTYTFCNGQSGIKISVITPVLLACFTTIIHAFDRLW